MYNNACDLLRLCDEKKLNISDIVIQNECKISDISADMVCENLLSIYSVMSDACKQTLDTELRSISGLTGGDAKRLNKYISDGNSLCGSEFLRSVSYAMSCFEVNTAMGCIVAAPTAGSCGIVPGVILHLSEKFSLSNQQIANALATASGVGQIITKNATVSGAEGGCQAECGSASAMAAAAAVEICGGSPTQAFHAAAMTLKNVLGLVCDPVAGLVEIPCEKRNAIGVANALMSTDLALAGIISNIPFDEVVDAMYRVGKQLPTELRETALGGVATCPTALAMQKKIFG